MKLLRLLNRLQKSTRITLMTCACLLVTTALVLLFLMFFPITQEEKQVISMSSPASPGQNDASAETYPVQEFNWDDVPHTLSTWSAGVNGFSRSLDEFTETEPETTSTDTTSTSEETTAVTETAETDISGETTESDESLIPPMPQTGTETIASAPETEAPETTMTEPETTDTSVPESIAE